MSLTTILLLALCVVCTGACTCFSENDPKEYCQNDIIIRGMALSETEEGEDYVYLVQVETVIKMPHGRATVNSIVVKSRTSDAMCGTRLPLKTSLLLLAYVDIFQVVRTGLCNGNRKWEELGATRQQLLTDNFVSKVCA